jgi:hypothetical protein
MALGLKLAPPSGVIDFHYNFILIVKLEKSSGLKVNGLELGYLVYGIIFRSKTKVQILFLELKSASPGGH